MYNYISCISLLSLSSQCLAMCKLFLRNLRASLTVLCIVLYVLLSIVMSETAMHKLSKCLCLHTTTCI